MSSIVERTINGVNIWVDSASASEIFFEEEFVRNSEELKIDSSPIQVCNALSQGKYTPLLLTWELLDKCSFSCPFCYIVGHSSHKVVRFAEIKNHIDDLISHGLFYCILTGGEAVLHPDFIEIYKYLKSNGIIVDLYTNGSLLKNEHIELFKQYPPFRLEITIYGITNAQFIKATGQHSFQAEEILSNILELKKNKINVICKTPLNKSTLPEFEAIMEWCKKFDVDFYYSTEMYEAYDGIDFNEFSLAPSIKNEYSAKKINKINSSYPNLFDDVSPKGKTCYSCGIKKYGLHINSGFEMMPCSETHLEETKSNIRQSGLSNSLSKYRDFIDRHSGKSIVGCDGCEASQVCKMCSAKSEIIRDEQNEIINFKVPISHCENKRREYHAILEELLK